MGCELLVVPVSSSSIYTDWQLAKQSAVLEGILRSATTLAGVAEQRPKYRTGLCGKR